MRVNARFEGAAEKQVEYLATTLDTSVSEVLRLSVDSYYTKLRSESTRKLRFLGKHVGKVGLKTGSKRDSAHTNLSVNYKAEIGKILADKFKPTT